MYPVLKQLFGISFTKNKKGWTACLFPKVAQDYYNLSSFPPNKKGKHNLLKIKQ
jgi:hypothetical protein